MNKKTTLVKFFNNNEVLNSYIREIRKFKPLTIEEEASLLKDYYENKNKEARDKIIKHNQLLVYSVAKEYAKDENEVLDYVNEGNIGLIEAFEDFEMERGYRFMTFAKFYAQRAMNAYLTRTKNMINRSNNAKLGKKIDAVKQKYYSEYGFMPSENEVMELIEKTYGIKVNDKVDVLDLSVSSIDDEITEDFTLEDDSEYNTKTSSSINYEKTIENDYYKAKIAAIFSSAKLPEKNAEMIKMLYGIGYDRAYTETEVGMKFGYSVEDINRIKRLILTYLKENVVYKTAI